MAEKFRYSTAQRIKILAVLYRHKVSLNDDISEKRFLVKVQRAAREALAHREHVRRERAKEREQLAGVRKEIRDQLIKPIKRAIEALDGMSDGARLWLPSTWTHPYYEHLPDSSKDPLRRVAAELEGVVESLKVIKGKDWADLFVESLAMVWEQHTDSVAGLRFDWDDARKAGPFREFVECAAGPAGLESSATERRLRSVLGARLKSRKQGVPPDVRGHITPYDPRFPREELSDKPERIGGPHPKTVPSDR